MGFEYYVLILDLQNSLENKDTFILAFPIAIWIVSFKACVHKYLNGKRMNRWLNLHSRISIKHVWPQYF